MRWDFFFFGKMMRFERRWSWISKHRFEIAEQNEGEIFHFFFSYQLCLAKLNSGIGRFKRPLALAWK